MKQIPIACSLTETLARDRLAEWRGLLDEAVAHADRISPTELALRLLDDPGQLDAIVRLAQREKACCPFFDFTLHIEADAIALHVEVPEDATAVLDEFRTAGAWKVSLPGGDSGPGKGK